MTVEDLGADGASPAGSTAASPGVAGRQREPGGSRGGATARTRAGGAAAASDADAGPDAYVFGEVASPEAGAAAASPQRSEDWRQRVLRGARNAAGLYY